MMVKVEKNNTYIKVGLERPIYIASKASPAPLVAFTSERTSLNSTDAAKAS